MIFEGGGTLKIISVGGVFCRGGVLRSYLFITKRKDRKMLKGNFIFKFY